MTNINEIEEICCPEFHSEDWQSKTFKWKEKQFIKDKVFTFFHIPIGFGRTMKKMDNLMTKSGIESQDWMCLADHTSKWNMDVYVDVNGPVTGIENINFNGNYYSRVFEGPYNKTGKFIDEFNGDVKSKGLNLKKLYMWYNYCPKCAKKYGNNYITIIGELE